MLPVCIVLFQCLHVYVCYITHFTVKYPFKIDIPVFSHILNFIPEEIRLLTFNTIYLLWLYFNALMIIGIYLSPVCACLHFMSKSVMFTILWCFRETRVIHIFKILNEIFHAFCFTYNIKCDLSQYVLTLWTNAYGSPRFQQYTC